VALPFACEHLGCCVVALGDRVTKEQFLGAAVAILRGQADDG
jgi:hypothetical protein